MYVTVTAQREESERGRSMWASTEQPRCTWQVSQTEMSNKELRVTGGCASVEGDGSRSGDWIQTNRNFEVFFSESDLVSLLNYCISKEIISFSSSIAIDS